jgi:hypothetical protein
MMTRLFLALNVIGIALFLAFDGLDIINISKGRPHDTLYIAEGLVALLGLLAYLGTFIPAVVFFCMWLHRVVRNMPALGSPDPRWTPGGAVGRCFIPVMNLWHPLYSVLDVWRGSWAGRRWVDVSARKAMAAPFLIVAWWSSWLGARLVSWFGSILGRANPDDVPIQAASIAIDAIGNLVLVAAAVLAILVVRDVTAQQERKNDLIASGQLV